MALFSVAEGTSTNYRTPWNRKPRERHVLFLSTASTTLKQRTKASFQSNQLAIFHRDPYSYYYDPRIAYECS